MQLFQDFSLLAPMFLHTDINFLSWVQYLMLNRILIAVDLLVIIFDQLSCFLMHRHEIWTKGVIYDAELNFDIS
jgi:hypothetical protein